MPGVKNRAKDQQREEERRAIGDLRHEFISPTPRFQARRRISASVAAGSVSLAWYRGKHAGQYDGYKALRRKFPAAAAHLLKHFGMNRDGSIG